VSRKILYYHICGLPFAFWLLDFSQRDVERAKKVYTKFGFKKLAIRGKKVSCEIKKLEGKKIAEDWLIRPVIDALFNLAEEFGFLLIHAAGISYRKKGFIFPAPSGGGKTTISKLAKQKAVIISDDAVVIKRVKSGYLIYGFPYTMPRLRRVKHYEKGVRLRKIYFIMKAKVTTIRPINRTKALRMALAQAANLISQRISQEKRGALGKYTYRFLEKLLDSLPFAELYFAKNRQFLRKI